MARLGRLSDFCDDVSGLRSDRDTGVSGDFASRTVDSHKRCLPMHALPGQDYLLLIWEPDELRHPSVLAASACFLAATGILMKMNIVFN